MTQERELIKARLNLYAVLRSLEDLVQLDADAAALVRDWHCSIQFSVRGGPRAFLEFGGGRCVHGRGDCTRPSVSLYFLSPEHLNRMFDGKGNPIPLRGFRHLGFLRRDFSRLTDMLSRRLRPTGGTTESQDGKRISAALQLAVALYAVPELAELDPVCRLLANGVGQGTVQFRVLADGAFRCVTRNGNGIQVCGELTGPPTARMTFRDYDATGRVLAGTLDPYQAVVEQAVVLEGQLPMIDAINLIMERVPNYLT